MDGTTQATFDTVMAFMAAMGGGDMEVMSSLMADDMVWRNEGDGTLPWIGESRGKEAIFDFLGVPARDLESAFHKNTKDDLREALPNFDELRARYADTPYGPMFDEVVSA